MLRFCNLAILWPRPQTFQQDCSIVVIVSAMDIISKLGNGNLFYSLGLTRFSSLSIIRENHCMCSFINFFCLGVSFFHCSLNHRKNHLAMRKIPMNTSHLRKSQRRLSSNECLKLARMSMNCCIESYLTYYHHS